MKIALIWQTVVFFFSFQKSIGSSKINFSKQTTILTVFFPSKWGLMMIWVALSLLPPWNIVELSKGSVDNFSSCYRDLSSTHSFSIHDSFVSTYSLTIPETHCCKTLWVFAQAYLSEQWLPPSNWFNCLLLSKTDYVNWNQVLCSFFSWRRILTLTDVWISVQPLKKASKNIWRLAPFSCVSSFCVWQTRMKPLF